MQKLNSKISCNPSSVKHGFNDSEEDSDFYNEEFVSKFFEFANFEHAAEWVNQQIRNKKYNPTSFADDFPALIKKGLEYRQGILVLNPQTPVPEISEIPGSFDQDLIMNQCIFNHGIFSDKDPESISNIAKKQDLAKPTKDDYAIHFVLSMLQAFCLNDNISPIVPRVILNTFQMQLKSKSVTLQIPRHQEWAMKVIENIRSELISDFIKRFSLHEMVTDELLQQIVHNQITQERYNDAARMITHYKFNDHFDLKHIMGKLMESGDPKKLETAKLLVQNYQNLKIDLVKAVCQREDWKTAQKLVKEYQLDPDNFPEMKHGVMKKSVQHYLGINLYQDIEQKECLALDRVEEMLIGQKEMMGYLVEVLLEQKKPNEAKGITLRHKLESYLRIEILQKLEQVTYEPKYDSALARYDGFEPLSRPLGEYCSLPDDVKLEWVDTERSIQKLELLKNEQFIGVDSEWRPQLSQYHKTKPSLFQISGRKTAFLIDLVTLQNSELLDELLTEIFSSPKVTIVGFGFSSDLDQFSSRLPHFKFIQYIKNFVDAQSYYCEMHNIQNQIGLAKVTKQLFGKSLCKVEQMSNWEMRPLRLSQQHYAALDAFILIEVIYSLIEKSVNDKRLPSFKKQIKTLDANELEEAKLTKKKQKRKR